MSVVWPSAGRALSLFTGAKTGVVDNSMVELTRSSTTREKSKRAAEDELEDSFDRSTIGTIHRPGGHPPPGHVGQVPLFAPKPHSIPSVVNLQRRYSQPQMGRPEPVFTGGQPDMEPLIRSPSSPLLADLSYMQDMDAFGAQLSTAVIPHLYSSGFLDDMEVPIHGLQSQQPQELQRYRDDNYYPSSNTTPSQMTTQLGHYDMQGAAPLYSQHYHVHHPQQQRQHPRLGRPISHHSDVYLPRRFNVYSESFPY